MVSAPSVNHSCAILTLFMSSLALLLRRGDESRELCSEAILYTSAAFCQGTRGYGRRALSQEMGEYASWRHQAAVQSSAWGRVSAL